MRLITKPTLKTPFSSNLQNCWCQVNVVFVQLTSMGVPDLTHCSTLLQTPSWTLTFMMTHPMFPLWISQPLPTSPRVPYSTSHCNQNEIWWLLPPTYREQVTVEIQRMHEELVHGLHRKDVESIISELVAPFVQPHPLSTLPCLPLLCHNPTPPPPSSACTC